MSERNPQKKTEGQDESAAKGPTVEPEQDLGPVDRAILELLPRVPTRWGPLDYDDATAAEQEALGLLTAGGFIERRIPFRIWLIGHPKRVEATIVVTGEYGLVEAVGPVIRAAWELWENEYLRRQAGAEEDKPCVHCERVGDEQARLTTDGEEARKDAVSGNVGAILAWVRRQPPFEELTVRGCGRAESIRVRDSKPEPVEVKVVNLPEIAAIIETCMSSMANDLIAMNVALEEYDTSERTIRSKVKMGELTDHRPPDHAKNAKLVLSRSELDRFFTRRPSKR
jgi:hypothetical protein